MSDSNQTSSANSTSSAASLELPMASLAVSVVIVNYNVKEFLEQALGSVEKALSEIKGEIIVVDNASTDGSVGMLRQKFPHVTLIANSENLGFAKSSNQGVVLARGKIVVLLNPDTIVQEDTFTETLAYFTENAGTGMVGCKILNPDGTLQLACRRSFPTPWVAFTKLSGLSHVFSRSRLFGRYNLTFLNPDETCEVEAISGSFMAVRRKTIKQVGLLDESFFMYGEDLDWCYRVGLAGWKVIYLPATQIIHFKGESSKKAQFDSLRIFYQAMGLFAQKHFKSKSLLFPYWLLRVAIWLRAGISFFASFLKSIIVPLSDLLLLSGSLVFGVYLRYGDLNSLDFFVPALIAYTAVWMTALRLFGVHDRSKFSSSKAALAILIGFSLNASLTFFFKQYAFSRAVVLYTGALTLLAVPGWRLLLKMLPRLGLMPFYGTLGTNLLARRTVIVGDMESAGTLIHKLRSQVESGYDITGFVNTNGRHTGEVVAGVTVLGDVSELNGLITAQNIQEVIFSTDQLSYDQILRIIAAAGEQKVTFKLIPSTLDVVLGKATIDRLDDIPLVEIDYKLNQRRYRVIKRLFDIILAIGLILLTLPLVLMKKYLSSDRLCERTLYGQESPFIVHEFCKVKSQRLRKLPYLWSVLKGQMSFVGGEIQEVISDAQDGFIDAPLVLQQKPGLTGLVQVNARMNLTDEDKEKYQIYYLKNYSILLDLEIVFKALFRI